MKKGEFLPNALACFYGALAVSEHSLHHKLKCDKVRARFAIGELLKLGLIENVAGMDHRINDKGIAKLVELELVEPAPERGSRGGKVTPQAHEPQFIEISAPERADFDTLVRQGLARLNQQMGLEPLKIKNAVLKIETLRTLAQMAASVDEPQTCQLLTEIAADIQRIADRSSK